MKKLLLLFILSTSLNAEDKTKKDENVTKNTTENATKNSKENSNPKKPEYLEINSVALDIARKKVEKEEQFFNSCNSLINELQNQKLVIEKGKKLYWYSPDELEKVLNIIKLKKVEVRNIQNTVMEIINDLLSQEPMARDSYLDDKEEVVRNTKNYLETFGEYFKEYENKEEKDKVRNKLNRAKKLKIDFKEVEKSSQETMKKLSNLYYKISDIIFAKLILDGVEGKNWEEKKANFKKELPNIQKAEAKMNEEMEESIKNKNDEKKGEQKDKNKEKGKTETVNPLYKQIIDTNFTYVLFPLYGYSSFNPYTVALNIEKIWKQKGLID